jgi:hypothetical protein
MNSGMTKSSRSHSPAGRLSKYGARRLPHADDRRREVRPPG